MTVCGWCTPARVEDLDGSPILLCDEHRKIYDERIAPLIDKLVIGQQPPWSYSVPVHFPRKMYADRPDDIRAERDELRRRTDAVRALCDEAEKDEPSAVFNQGGPMWSVWTTDVRKALDGDT